MGAPSLFTVPISVFRSPYGDSPSSATGGYRDRFRDGRTEGLSKP